MPKSLLNVDEKTSSLHHVNLNTFVLDTTTSENEVVDGMLLRVTFLKVILKMGIL
jgi:hypothetical protein